jgi:Apea-like HEPN
MGAGRSLDAGGRKEDEIGPTISRVRDVVVIPSPGHDANAEDWLAYRAVDGPVDLGNGITLERLRGEEADLAEQVIHAAVPRGQNFEPVRQFGQMYSFWREVPAEEWSADSERRLFHWDTTQAVTEALFLSRFVLDNGYSLEYAGRVIDRSDGYRRICPLTGHDARLAYRARKSRFWFTNAEAIELRTFLDNYRAAENALPQRVKRATFQAEASAQSRYLSDAIAHLTTGLEALLNTDEDVQITAQFVKRSKQLADELGIDGTSHTYWTWIYTARSKVVHGAEVKLVAPEGWYEGHEEPPADVKKIAKAQDVLRAAVRRAIEEDDFRAVFDSNEAIAARWPLPT